MTIKRTHSYTKTMKKKGGMNSKTNKHSDGLPRPHHITYNIKKRTQSPSTTTFKITESKPLTKFPEPKPLLKFSEPISPSDKEPSDDQVQYIDKENEEIDDKKLFKMYKKAKLTFGGKKITMKKKCGGNPNKKDKPTANSPISIIQTNSPRPPGNSPRSLLIPYDEEKEIRIKQDEINEAIFEDRKNKGLNQDTIDKWDRKGFPAPPQQSV